MLSAFFASFAYAESVADIKFPIAELGSCENKEACKAYCDNEENFSACRAYASKNKIKGTSEHDKKFEIVGEDGGPGNCAAGSDDPLESCRLYCDDISHMKECVSYAKTHDLMDEGELEEAEKVLSAIDRGAKLPSGCKNKETCQKICEEPANISVARECFAFAEEAGLLPPEVNREQAEKVFKAIEEGRAPFKSAREFEQCENPGSEEIMEKCINFALENGFLSGEEAEMVKKTGGKGPGGCRGKKQCEAYCEANQDECFEFAETNGLISAEEKANMSEGINKFREALSQAPEEVKRCLEDSLGKDAVEQILAGKKRANQAVGEKMRACFDSVQGGRSSNDSFPSEIKSCIISQIGEEGFKQLTENGPTPELDEKMRSCFERKDDGDESRRPPEEERYEDRRPEMEDRGGSEEEMRKRFEDRQNEMRSENFERNFENRPEGFKEGEYPSGEYRQPPEEFKEEYQDRGENYQMPPREEMQFPQGESILPPAGGDTPPPEPPAENRLNKVEKQSLLANIIIVFNEILE